MRGSSSTGRRSGRGAGSGSGSGSGSGTLDDRLERRRVLDRLLERLDRGRRSLLLRLSLVLLSLSGFRGPEELGERALTHAGALSRH